uniref:Large subunit GTPase 1 homolog n=1 Tax=Globodera pallida TaxID=36090 RepID=A0A183C927_GLOPA
MLRYSTTSRGKVFKGFIILHGAAFLDIVITYKVLVNSETSRYWLARRWPNGLIAFYNARDYFAGDEIGTKQCIEDRKNSSCSAFPNLTIFDNDKETTQSECTYRIQRRELLTNAELANETFEAERSDVKLLASNGTVAISLAPKAAMDSLKKLNENYGHLLRIPRRPRPGTYADAEQLNALEAEEFVTWRRQLAKLSESNVVITPFERNLEIWRQLWRVVERSHLVVQVVDARNPLLFRSSDLEHFVREVDPKKQCLLLVNKADLITTDQLRAWKDFFYEQGINAIFCAKHVKEEVQAGKNSVAQGHEECANLRSNSCSSTTSSEEEIEETGSAANVCAESDGSDETDGEMEEDDDDDKGEDFVWNPTQLIAMLHQAVSEAFPDILTRGSSCVIGMVGYPNVGKSMTINRLFGTKKTAVSATPGKTKHFQTLVINDQLTLCDCPGLVMPQFGLSDADMILNGILPIAHMRDYLGPIQLLCERIPRICLQQRYSVLLPAGAHNQINAHDLLTAVAFLKGFMSASGIPDCSRAARLILSDVVDGSLKWVAAPPNFTQQHFDQWTFATAEKSKAHQQQQQAGEGEPNKRQIGANLLEQLERRQLLVEQNDGATTTPEGYRLQRKTVAASRLDKMFFTESKGKKLGTDVAHIQGGVGRLELAENKDGKKKHWNKNKREKLRRLCAKND